MWNRKNEGESARGETTRNAQINEKRAITTHNKQAQEPNVTGASREDPRTSFLASAFPPARLSLGRRGAMCRNPTPTEIVVPPHDPDDGCAPLLKSMFSTLRELYAYCEENERADIGGEVVEALAMCQKDFSSLVVALNARSKRDADGDGDATDDLVGAAGASSLAVECGGVISARSTRRRHVEGAVAGARRGR